MRISLGSPCVLLCPAFVVSLFFPSVAFPDKTFLRDDTLLTDYPAKLAAEFAADPQLVARVANGEDLSAIEAAFRRHLSGDAGDKSPSLGTSPAQASPLRDVRIVKALPGGDAIVTFRLAKQKELSRAAEAMRELAHQPSVKWIEPIHRDFYLSATNANDPFFNTTGAWGQSYFDLWGLHTIGAPDAWDTTTGDEGRETDARPAYCRRNRTNPRWGAQHRKCRKGT